MEQIVYSKLKEFKKRYPLTVGWRLKSHCKVVEKHLNPGEIVNYVFVAQKNDTLLDFISTYVVVLTNRRILLAQKRVLFNDLKVRTGIIWTKIYIDTAKEFIKLSKIQKSASDEIETAITEYMMEEKRKYGLRTVK